VCVCRPVNDPSRVEPVTKIYLFILFKEVIYIYIYIYIMKNDVFKL
jgi:hypothetical protein